MSSYFIDTSALAKNYLTETGSTWIQNLIAPAAGNVIVICELTPVEYFSYLARRLREKTLNTTHIAVLQTAFLKDYQDHFLSVELEKPILIQARNLVTKYPSRPPDAIQLACALDAINTLKVPLTFICADNALLATATAEGFATDNPNLHP